MRGRKRKITTKTVKTAKIAVSSHASDSDAVDEADLLEFDHEYGNYINNQFISKLEGKTDKGKVIRPTTHVDSDADSDYSLPSIGAPNDIYSSDAASEIGDYPEEGSEDSVQEDGGADSAEEFEKKHVIKPAIKQTKLPIKDTTGKLIFPKTKQQSPPPSDDDEDDAEDDAESDPAAGSDVAESDEEDDGDPVPKSKSQLMEYLANAAAFITANPEGNISKLKPLLHLVKLLKHKPSYLHITLLAITSIFKDIIPGYKIREKDVEEKLSKEVKKLWQYEQQLLSSYQNFLQILDQQDPIICIPCFEQLVLTHPHFNFTSNISAALVSFSTKYDSACAVLEEFLKVDFEKTGGEGSVVVLKLLADLVKRRSVPARVLKVVSSVKLSYAKLGEDEKKTQSRHLSKKARKLEKIKKEVEKEQAETLAQHASTTVRRNQARVLEFVFLIYFRILKAEKPKVDVLSEALEGIKKFAEWVDVTVWADLVSTIRGIASVPATSFLELIVKLKAVLVTLEIVEASRGAIVLDMKEWVAIMYVCILDSVQFCDDKNEFWTLVFRALYLLLVKQTTGAERVAALLKRVFVVLLSDSSPTISHVFASLSLLKACVLKYPKVTGLLDPEGATTSGVYQPTIPDPDLSNPFATLLWELSLLKRHAHPMVTKFVNSVMKFCEERNVVFPKEFSGTPEHFLEAWNTKGGERFVNAFVATPRFGKHLPFGRDWWMEIESATE